MKTMHRILGSLSVVFRLRPHPEGLPPLPIFRGGEELIDIADRDALHRAMEER